MLIVVDFKNEIFYFMDPLKKQCCSEKYFKRWIEFTKLYDRINETAELSVIKWKFKTMYENNIPKQQDGSNCGVLCLMHIDYLSNHQSNSNADRFKCPEVYRDYTKSLLLRNSDKMVNMCLKCGEKMYINEYVNSEDTQMIQCDYCQRWIHFGCYHNDTTENKHPFSYFNQKSTKYQCFLNH